MNRCVFTTGRGAVFLAIGLASGLFLLPVASAEPTLPQAGSQSAADTVTAYQAAGFDVQIQYLEGRPNVGLADCRVTAIRNFNGPMASLMMLSTVDIDVVCPNAK
ncbi:hypothetical protein BH09ACT8_BH09ACT8_33470 [soil metagenome]